MDREEVTTVKASFCRWLTTRLERETAVGGSRAGPVAVCKRSIASSVAIIAAPPCSTLLCSFGIVEGIETAGAAEAKEVTIALGVISWPMAPCSTTWLWTGRDWGSDA